jgi:hydrogenase expression/formation protein HypC
VDVSLLEGVPAPGDWLLVHVGIAIRGLEPEEAGQIADALRAVDAAARGEPFEHLIADLIDREPQLPPHLRGGAEGGSGNG